MNSFPRSLLRKTAVAALVAGTIFGSASGAPVALQDVPLYLLSRADPNVLINMSVETPMGGAAYTDHVGVPAGCAGRTDVSGQQRRGLLLPDGRVPRLLQSQEVLRVCVDPIQPDGHCCGDAEPHVLGRVERQLPELGVDDGHRHVHHDDDGRQPHRRYHRRKRRDCRAPRAQDGQRQLVPDQVCHSSTNVAPNTVTPYSDATLYFYNTAFGFNAGTTFDEARNASGTGFKGRSRRLYRSVRRRLPASKTTTAFPTARTPSLKVRSSAMRAPSASERSATAPTARTLAMAAYCART